MSEFPLPTETAAVATADDGGHEMKFCLQGRFIFGGDVRSLPVTVFFVAPLFVFCVFVATNLMDDFPNHWGISIVVIPAFLAFIRNYRCYFMLVLTTALTCVYVHGFCWVYITTIMSTEGISIWKAITKTLASIILIAYTFIAFWFPGGLIAFHLYLISKNKTTCENAKSSYDEIGNPFDKGIIGNFLEVFCSSIPPSKINFREKVPKDPTTLPRMRSGSASNPGTEKLVGDIEMGLVGNNDDLDKDDGVYDVIKTLFQSKVDSTKYL